MGIQQPGRFAEADAFQVLVLGLAMGAGEQVRGGVDRHVAGVLEGQGRFDLLGLLRGGRKEDEVDVLTARRLGIQAGAQGVLQAARTSFTFAQLEQIGDLPGQFHRLVDMFGGDQGTALGLPALTEGIQYAVAPVATRHQGHGAAHAVIPGAASHFAGFVLGGQAELEQLRRAFLTCVAVIQGEGGDWQLFAVAELLDQRFFQRTDHQLYAIGLCLLVEGIQRANPGAVVELDFRWVLPGLLRFVMGGEEAVTQGAGDTGQLAFLG